MHLIDILHWRAVPASGISVGITRRCPLTCAHCSTQSTMQSEEISAKLLKRFVGTFSATSAPKFMAMSGGEAMLRPQLVAELAHMARVHGVKTSVLSGMFFAKHGHIPKKVWAAINAVDHFSVSIDAFHEREVPRQAVFKTLKKVLNTGKNISIHIAGQYTNDPYVDDLITDIDTTLGQDIPLMVNTLSGFGRAVKNGLVTIVPKSSKTLTTHVDTSPNPCTMAAWPVLGFDGTVAACGNDNLIGNVPKHLQLGHIEHNDWATIALRCQTMALLRMIRMLGPIATQEKLQKLLVNTPNATSCIGYCSACIDILKSDATTTANALNMVNEYMSTVQAQALESLVISMQQNAGAVQFAKRYAHPKYAQYVMRGYPNQTLSTDTNIVQPALSA